MYLVLFPIPASQPPADPSRKIDSCALFRNAKPTAAPPSEWQQNREALMPLLLLSFCVPSPMGSRTLPRLIQR